jgi:hypothetical protein
MKKYLSAFLFIVILTLSGCGGSGSESEYVKPELSVNADNVYVWADLMPGGDPKLYATGEFTVRNSGMVITWLSSKSEGAITQGTQYIMKFNPDLNLETDSLKLLPGESRMIKFTTPKGLDLKNLNKDGQVDILFGVKAGREIFNIQYKSVPVDKVY